MLCWSLVLLEAATFVTRDRSAFIRSLAPSNIQGKLQKIASLSPSSAMLAAVSIDASKKGCYASFQEQASGRARPGSRHVCGRRSQQDHFRDQHTAEHRDQSLEAHCFRLGYRARSKGRSSNVA